MMKRRNLKGWDFLMARKSKDKISIKVNRGDDNNVSRNIENYARLTSWARWLK